MHSFEVLRAAARLYDLETRIVETSVTEKDLATRLDETENKLRLENKAHWRCYFQLIAREKKLQELEEELADLKQKYFFLLHSSMRKAGVLDDSIDY